MRHFYFYVIHSFYAYIFVLLSNTCARKKKKKKTEISRNQLRLINSDNVYLLLYFRRWNPVTRQHPQIVRAT